MEHGDSLVYQSVECIYGDCLSVMDEYDPESFDMSFTDPPYLMGYQSNYRSKDASDSSAEKMKQKKIKSDTLETGIKMIKGFFPRLYRVLKKDSYAFVCFKPDGRDTDNTYIDLGAIFKGEAVKSGLNLRNTIIWIKNNWSAGDLTGGLGVQCEHIMLLAKGNPKLQGDKRYTDAWHFDRVPDKDRIHPNQKPIPLIKRALEIGSNEGSHIIDPFGGSGVTGITAHSMNRESVLIEYDQERFDEMALYVNEKTMPGLF